jgi:drug/metabolite transporter (DMT)-like permease
MNAPPASRPAVALGAFLIVCAFACVAVMSALAKGAGSVPASVLAFFQSAIPLVLLSPWALRGGIRTLTTKRIPLHLLRAGAGLLSQVLMFVAVKKMPLVNAVLLANSAPLFIPLVSRVWLKKPVRAPVLAGLGVGCVGVVLVLRPSLALLTNPVALITLAAAVCSAFALVSVNRLSETEPAPRVLFYYFLVSTLASLPFAMLAWVAPTSIDWAFLGGIGLMMAASQVLILQAYRHATASRIAAFNYAVVVFSGLIGWAVWKDAPGWLSLVGVLLVTTGGILSTVFGGPRSTGHLGWLGFANHSRAVTA